MRTGRGNLKASKACAEAHWSSLDTSKTGVPFDQAIALYIQGQAANALAAFRHLYSKDFEKNLMSGAIAAVVADGTGDKAVRDALFVDLITKWRRDSPIPELADMFCEVLRHETGERWDSHAFEVLITNCDDDGKVWLYLLAGLFLGNHGEQTFSQEYLQAAATTFRTERFAGVVATQVLRKQKIVIGKRLLTDLPDSIAPLAELVRKAKIARESGLFDQAEDALSQALQTRADFLPAMLARGDLFELQEKYAEAIQEYEQIAKLDPNLISAWNKQAWIYATCPKDEIRNGQKAMECAERASSIHEFKSADTLNALAAAHAELGQFDKAVELANRAGQLEGGSATVESYYAKKPYRSQPKRQLTTAP